MPTLADSVRLLKVGDKAFKDPEWWSTQHKLRKHTKYNEAVKKVVQNANFGINYRVVTLENQPKVDEYIYTMASKMDYPLYKELAPWIPAFRKSKTIITFSE